MAELDLTSLQQQITQHAATLPPVDQWDPAFCGDIDMQIKHDGSWFYMGTPIGRLAMVKLFAGILRRENDAYFLVTPAEKVGIQVADVPFIITQWQQADECLMLTTNLDDSVVVNAQHPITLLTDKISGQQLPYVLVRKNLWARLHQNVFYQLAEFAQQTRIGDEWHLTIRSDNQSFSLGRCE